MHLSHLRRPPKASRVAAVAGSDSSPLTTTWRWRLFTEGEQLPAVPAGAGAPHRLPALPLGQLHARHQADPHRPQAGEHPLRQLRLRHRVQPQKGTTDGTGSD